MKVVVDEKKFKEIFRQATIEYEYECNFMRPDEKYSDFQNTQRCSMLKRFRNTLNHLKNQLMEE